MGSPLDAVDDAAQQVFIIFADRVAQVEHGREKAFLVATAVRVAANARRLHQRSREVPTDDLDDIAAPPSGSRGATPEQLLDWKQRRERLDEALDELPFEQRTVFVLFELEGFSLPEIADAVGVPLGTATSRLRRARRAFRTGSLRDRTTEGSHEITRMLEGGGSSAARDLLESARVDEPPRSAFARTAASIGVAGAGMALSSAVHGATASGAIASTAKAGVVSTMVIAKWVLIGAVTGGAFVTTAVFVATPPRNPAPAVVQAPRPIANDPPPGPRSPSEGSSPARAAHRVSSRGAADRRTPRTGARSEPRASDADCAGSAPALFHPDFASGSGKPAS